MSHGSRYFAARSISLMYSSADTSLMLGWLCVWFPMWCPACTNLSSIWLWVGVFISGHEFEKAYTPVISVLSRAWMILLVMFSLVYPSGYGLCGHVGRSSMVIATLNYITMISCRVCNRVRG